MVAKIQTAFIEINMRYLRYEIAGNFWTSLDFTAIVTASARLLKWKLQ